MNLIIAPSRWFPSLFEWIVTWGGALERHTVLALTPERSVMPAIDDERLQRKGHFMG
jgi:hypothetical protein